LARLDGGREGWDLSKDKCEVAVMAFRKELLQLRGAGGGGVRELMKIRENLSAGTPLLAWE
jgi:hypothetical protein